MFDLKKPAMLALFIGLSTVAQAQETTTEAPAAEAPATEAPAAPEAAPADPAAGGAGIAASRDAAQVGRPYLLSKEGAWDLRCVRVDDGKEPCQLYQLLSDTNGNSVAEISLIALPEGQDAVTGATIVTPLETLLAPQLALAVDGAQSKLYPFTFCATIGCIARLGFTAEDLDSFRKGKAATLTVVPVVAPDQTVVVNISLEGFTAAYAKLVEVSKPQE